MVWCSYCAKDQVVDRDDINGFMCCTGCGRVLDDNVYSAEPTFCKGSSGQSQLVGNIIRSGQFSRIGSDPGFHSISHEKTLERGRNEISEIAATLSISGRDDAVGAAHRLYVLAVEKSFTKGRRTQQVAAACLYIVCRQENKPYLLIDFSDSLQVNVYVLGAVFMQLCRLLRLDDHPIMAKPVDPSLFIHRFTDRLLALHASSGRKHHAIANTALRIVASMKRDWIQTGRKPSGVCGAALFVSAQIHGLDCSKSDVVSVVHVCGDTLSKRLVEFGNTESGALTPEEFEAKARELEVQAPVVNVNLKGHITEILCEHKEVGASHHAHGLCKSCFDEFMKVSGGLEGESNPPAFQQAEKKRFDAQRRKLKQFLLEDDAETSPVRGKRKFDADTLQDDIDLKQLESFSQEAGSTITKNSEQACEPHLSVDETLSDLDDEEMNAYLNNDDEVRLKTLVWTEMNKDYLEELEAKESAIAASEAAQAAALSAISSGTGSAADLAAAAAAAVANTKKARKARKVAEKKPPAESAAEAARQMLESKKLSSRVNFDVLDKLFDGEALVDAKSSPKPNITEAEKITPEPIESLGTETKETNLEEEEHEQDEDGDEEEDGDPGDYTQHHEEEYYEEY